MHVHICEHTPIREVSLPKQNGKLSQACDTATLYVSTTVTTEHTEAHTLD